MPSNADIAFNILVGGVEIPEYEKNGLTYVESNLYTPYSYKHRQTDSISGELETQEWPVTPYKIQVRCFTPERCYVRVFVDGVKVKGLGLQHGDEKLVKGFRDNKVLREFLFSMPRFAKDEGDRLDNSRVATVGKVVVECWKAELRRSNWEVRKKGLDFNQANKKDCYKVTGGAYTLATSCAGKVVTQRTQFRNVDSWRRVSLMSSLSVTYHMGHTLQEMGMQLRPIPFTSSPIKLVKKDPSGCSSSSGWSISSPQASTSHTVITTQSSTGAESTTNGGASHTTEGRAGGTETDVLSVLEARVKQEPSQKTVAGPGSYDEPIALDFSDDEP